MLLLAPLVRFEGLIDGVVIVLTTRLTSWMDLGFPPPEMLTGFEPGSKKASSQVVYPKLEGCVKFNPSVEQSALADLNSRSSQSVCAATSPCCHHTY